MSGIAGVCHFNAPSGALVDLYASVRAMRHRGPDGVACWHDDYVAFGHLLLATEGPQPPIHQLARANSGNVCVADVRLDNRDSLCRVLAPRLAPGDLSDAELILLAWERWGRESPRHLLGDFAFAIWDHGARMLHCVRDPMGVRPLYLHVSSTRIAFATEIPALLALDGVSATPDAVRVAQHLAWEENERERTFFASVRRVRAAHVVSIDRDRVLRSRYWDPADAETVRFRTEAEYAAAFRDLLESSVATRVPVTGAVSTSLSGGLDSSSVACIAQRVLAGRTRGPLHAVSLIFPSFRGADLRRIDERSFMRSVAARAGLEPEWLRGDLASPLQDAHSIVATLAEPFAAPNLFLHRLMYRAAAAAGSRVFLDGFDGDTAVSHGLSRLDELVVAEAWDTFETEAKGFSAHRTIDPRAVVLQHGLPVLTHLWQTRRWAKWARAALQMRRRFSLGLTDLVWRHGAAAAEADTPMDTRESHLQSLTQPLYQSTLELADRCAAATRLEPRYPFFDRRLIEFCVGLPPEQKMAGGWTRVVLRRAMEGILPGNVQWRATKANLSPAFDHGFTRGRDTAMRADFTLLEPYTDVAHVSRLRRRAFEEGQDVTRTEAFLLYRAVTLALWLQQHSAGAWCAAEDQLIPHDLDLAVPGSERCRV